MKQNATSQFKHGIGSYLINSISDPWWEIYHPTDWVWQENKLCFQIWLCVGILSLGVLFRRRTFFMQMAISSLPLTFDWNYWCNARIFLTETNVKHYLTSLTSLTYFSFDETNVKNWEEKKNVNWYLTPLTSPPPFFSPVAASSSLTDLCNDDIRIGSHSFRIPVFCIRFHYAIRAGHVQKRLVSFILITLLQNQHKPTLSKITCRAWPCFTMRSLQVWRFSSLAAIPLIAFT